MFSRNHVSHTLVRRIVGLTVLSAGIGLAGVARGQVADLTRDGAVARGTARATILDTRTVVPQIQASWPWDGPVQVVPEHLPGHTRRPLSAHTAQGRVARPGGLLDESRVAGGALFPGIGQTPWAPPDPTLAVGPNHIVETVNMAIAFFDKEGNLQFSQNLDSTGDPGFFEEVGAGTFTFDPKCFYDHRSGRFVVVALEVYGSSQSYIDIAVSDDDDPNGVWYKYRTDSRVRVGDAEYWVDYPGVGFDDQGLYVTGNLFKLNGQGSGWAGVIYRIFDKAPMLDGQDVSFSSLRDGRAASVQVAHPHGDILAPMFVSLGGGVKIQAIVDPLTNPTLVTTSVSVPSFSGPAGDAETCNGGVLDTIDGRINNAHWRDGQLYASHGIGKLINGSRNMARWYHIDTGRWPELGAPRLIESGQVDLGEGTNTWFPAVYSNADGDVGLVMAHSDSSRCASVDFTGRAPTDPLGTMGALTVMYQSEGSYRGRWGDYFDLTIDASDDRTFWAVGEYVRSGGGSWGTWIGSFTVDHSNSVGCDDFKKIKARCKGNGTIKGKVVLKDTSHDQSVLTVSVGPSEFPVVVDGKKAKFDVCCFSTGDVRVALVRPVGCDLTADVSCP